MTRHAIARAALWALRRVYRVKDSDLAALLRREAERWDRTAGPDPWVLEEFHRGREGLLTLDAAVSEIGKELAAGRAVVVEMASTGRRVEYRLPERSAPEAAPGAALPKTTGADPEPSTAHPWVEPILRRLAREPEYLFRLQAAERAQLDILRSHGWVVVRDGVVELTEMGREALGLEGP